MTSNPSLPFLDKKRQQRLNKMTAIMLLCQKNTKDNSNCNEAKNHNLTSYAHSQIQFCPEENRTATEEQERVEESTREATEERRKSKFASKRLLPNCSSLLSILKLKLFCCCKGHSTRVEFGRTAQEHRREMEESRRQFESR